jgi:hypothetical protein
MSAPRSVCARGIMVGRTVGKQVWAGLGTAGPVRGFIPFSFYFLLFCLFPSFQI